MTKTCYNTTCPKYKLYPQEQHMHNSFIDTIHSRGISIRYLNILMLVVSIIASVFLYIVTQKTNSVFDETHQLTQSLISARENSDDVRDASDYLTEQMRSFVVTGNRTFLDNYLTEVNVTKRRDKALEQLQALSQDEKAANALKAAIAESRLLEDQEYYAAHLAAIGYGYDITTLPEVVQAHPPDKHCEELTDAEKKELAIELLFNDDYQTAKELIYQHTTDCLNQLLNAAHEAQLSAAGLLKSYVFAGHVLALVLLISILLIILSTTILVIRPVTKAVALIREEKDIPPEGAYEMRFLAKTYNLMNTTQLQSKQKLDYEANHDKLTGIYNRRGYDYLLSNTDLETSALMLIDVDHFKRYNDTYGHEMGDRVLKKVADVLKTSFRSDDFVCRIGGDEFAVILIHLGPSLLSLVQHKYDSITKKLSETLDDIPAITISTGVAFGEDRITSSALFKNADTALYEAKEAGRSALCFYHYETERT